MQNNNILGEACY